jgi:glycosyltransferase involved in cell wall biosynthesis
MDIENIKKIKPIFDTEWYQERYPDVALVGIDPWEHFCRIGYRLDRHLVANARSSEALRILSAASDPVNPADGVAYSIDTALGQAITRSGPELDVRGWCFSSRDLSQSLSIEVSFENGESFFIPVDRARPDVFQIHVASYALQSDKVGFSQSITLQEGLHLVTFHVVINDRRVILERKILQISPKFRQVSVGSHDYDLWVQKFGEPTAEEIIEWNAEIQGWASPPIISVIMPVYQVKLRYLQAAVESVRQQIYPHWELCIADDASVDPALRSYLQELMRQDSRVKVHFRQVNGHISEATNTAISISTGGHLAFMDQDDLLTGDALYHVAKAIIDHPEANLIYSDEDKIDDQGKRSEPFFKPDWNPDLLLSTNYICHLLCCSRLAVDFVGGLRKGVEGSQDWDLILRITEHLADPEIIHIHRVLYHWRLHEGSTAQTLGSKDYILSSSKRVLEETMARRGIQGALELQYESHWRIDRAHDESGALASIIIPTRNRVDLLRQCIQSILDKTTYRTYEILIVDNDSDDPETLEYLESLQSDSRIRVIKISGPFNYSRLNNLAVKETKGEIIVLLNNDTEVITPGWLSEMVAQARRSEIGCVGALLLYPDDTIQHAGVILGLGGVAGHAFKHLPGFQPVYAYLNLLNRNYSAVTAACLAIRKSVYEEVNGLDEENLTVAFNDVDFCIRVNEEGYRNLYTPNAVLYHHESVSRGTDESEEKIKRFQSEIFYMKKTWKEKLNYDPNYNFNLCLGTEQFHLAFAPRHHEKKTN